MYWCIYSQVKWRNFYLTLNLRGLLDRDPSEEEQKEPALFLERTRKALQAWLQCRLFIQKWDDAFQYNQLSFFLASVGKTFDVVVKEYSPILSFVVSWRVIEGSLIHLYMTMFEVVFLLAAMVAILYNAVQLRTRGDDATAEEEENPVMYLVLFGYGVLVCAVSIWGLFFDFLQTIGYVFYLAPCKRCLIFALRISWRGNVLR